MTTILTFDTARCRPPTRPLPALEALSGPAKVLMFTGVRRERLLPRSAPHAPRHHEPMFNDPAPSKPTGKKRGRGKTL